MVKVDDELKGGKRGGHPDLEIFLYIHSLRWSRQRMDTTIYWRHYPFYIFALRATELDC